jgi:hypothetical protein
MGLSRPTQGWLMQAARPPGGRLFLCCWIPNLCASRTIFDTNLLVDGRSVQDGNGLVCLSLIRIGALAILPYSTALLLQFLAKQPALCRERASFAEIGRAFPVGTSFASSSLELAARVPAPQGAAGPRAAPDGETSHRVHGGTKARETS